jgi:hypothetical protein
MTRAITYVRFNEWRAKTFDCSLPDGNDRVVVVDVVGERRTPSFRDRLQFLPAVGADVLLLRGMSQKFIDDIRNGDLSAEIDDLGKNHRAIGMILTNPQPALYPVIGEEELFRESSALLRAARHAEVRAMLSWSDGVWMPAGFHFILPSGEHSKSFVRVADALTDLANVERLVDWFAHLVRRRTFVFADTATILPLLQGLEIRAMQAFPDCEVVKRILPLYDLPPERVAVRFAELDAWNRRGDAEASSIVAIISVHSSGGYLQRFREALAECESRPCVHFVIICNTGDTLDEDALCQIETGRHNVAECDPNSKAIEVDQKRFTTRVLVDVEVSPLPKNVDVAERRTLLEDIDRHAALRVHVERAERGDHVAAYLSTPRLLKSRVFSSKANYELFRTIAGWQPDLALVPQHTASRSVVDWLQSHGIQNAIEIPIRGECSQDILDKIGSAKNILLSDDCVITSHTMRSMLEAVQRHKAAVADHSYAVRGFVLVDRTAHEKTWLGLSNRFNVDFVKGLTSGWQLPLPDYGAADRGSCPWCIERSFLSEARLRSHGSARDYIEQRIARLDAVEGLESNIFMLSEVCSNTDITARRTSPKSYMGDISDVGAYVFAATMVQTVRRQWEKTLDQFHKRHVIGFSGPLRYYTDPVIAAALLRAIAASESWSAETGAELTSALHDINHANQHAVLAAEIIFAGTRGKLPKTFPYAFYGEAHADVEHLAIPGMLDLLGRMI